MVFAEMGGRITGAFQRMSNANIVDDEALTECLDEISKALMAADVHIDIIATMQANIRTTVNLAGRAKCHKKRKIIQQAVFEELCHMFDGGQPSFVPRKGNPNVIIVVGLQGSGKTTMCTKYASRYQSKGWNPALVCADTSRAGAFDQLKRNATKAWVPFYGSNTETDPVKIAQEGVARFKEDRDLIIVDTSGRHKQEAGLFEEMGQLVEATSADLVIFVVDSRNGQAAIDQVQAFKRSVAVGAVIMTKLDGHGKGGGALTAVAATRSPIIFLGTGKRVDKFEAFETRVFVSRLLGLGDWSKVVEKLQEALPMDLMHNIEQGNHTLRTIYKQYQILLNMDPFGKGMQMGLLACIIIQELMPQGGEKESLAKVKKFMTMMDSMTNEELDSTDLTLIKHNSFISRIARTSGQGLPEVHELLEECKRLAKIRSRIGGDEEKGFNAQLISKAFPHRSKQYNLHNFMKNVIGIPGL